MLRSRRNSSSKLKSRTGLNSMQIREGHSGDDDSYVQDSAKRAPSGHCRANGDLRLGPNPTAFDPILVQGRGPASPAPPGGLPFLAPGARGPRARARGAAPRDDLMCSSGGDRPPGWRGPVSPPARKRWREWSPQIGGFLQIDGYAYQDANSTLWGWPRQNPLRWRDLTGHDGELSWTRAFTFFSPEATPYRSASMTSMWACSRRTSRASSRQRRTWRLASRWTSTRIHRRIQTGRPATASALSRS
jgi:hypothetical protein